MPKQMRAEGAMNPSGQRFKYKTKQKSKGQHKVSALTKNLEHTIKPTGPSGQRLVSRRKTASPLNPTPTTTQRAGNRQQSENDNPYSRPKIGQRAAVALKESMNRKQRKAKSPQRQY